MRHKLFRLFCCSLVVVLFAASGYGQASSQGQWSALENWPTRAVHSTLLPDGRVFFVSYYDESAQPNIWDPVADTFSATAANSYDLFCAGHTSMADGRVFIAGGHIADYTGFAHAVIYDPFSDSFTQVPDMNEGRWYPTTTVLSNGDILVVSGDVNGNSTVDPLPQVFQVATGTWRDLTTAQLMQELYPVMFVAPNGQVIYAGPDPLTRYLDTSGTGAWTDLATRQFSGFRDYGPGVMYDTGKILEVGGSDPPTATAETIDLNAATPAWSFTGSMNFPRRQHNAVILPDGKVFIVGGSSGGGFDDDTNPVFPTEMWDPATGQFTVMASIAVYRGYHSTALLLPDGRVVSAGGNVGGANAQVYSPPYLFAGARPSISSAPTGVGYGQTVLIGTPDAANIANVTWIRLGSTTHTFDESTRFMQLSFTQTGGGLNVTMPANGNLAPPGYYMLFILDGSGIPSVAKIIQISQGGGGSGTLTGRVTNTSGAPLANVSVSAANASASTAPDGTYTMVNVNAGSTTVTATLSGYQGGSQDVTVTAGSTTNVPTIQLAPINPGGISGSVVNAEGGGIAGATVTGAGLTATTDGNGAYTFNNVPAGSVTLNASAPGFQPNAETVTVTAGNTTSASPITLASNQGNVSGKVTDSSNNAISGASVSFGGGSATTDANGNYSFVNIPAGTIQLVATANGFQAVTHNVTVAGGSTSTSNFSLLHVAAGGTQMTGFSTPDGLAHTFYLTTDQHIAHIFRSDSTGWQAQDVTAVSISGNTTNHQPAAGSAITGLLNPGGAASSFYFLDANQHLHETYDHNDNIWHDNDLTSLFGLGPATAGSALISYSGAGSINMHVQYVGSDTHIHDLYHNSSSGWADLDVTANSISGNTTNHQPAAGTALTGLLNPGGAAVSFYFVDANQHIHETYSHNDEKWHDNDLTTLFGLAPAAAGTKLTSYTGSGSINMHITYVGSDGHIHDLYHNSSTGWADLDVTANTISGNTTNHQPVAGTPLTGLLNPGGRAVSFYFVDANQHIHETYSHNDETWHDNDMTTLLGMSATASGSVLFSYPVPGSIRDMHIHYQTTDQHIQDMFHNTSTGWASLDANTTF